MAVHTISACLVLEEQRLAEARAAIMVRSSLFGWPYQIRCTDCLFCSNGERGSKVGGETGEAREDI